MKKNGFTLVELLAVIVILGALSIIIIPRINDAIESSRKNSAVVSANEYSKAITQYFLNNESNISASSTTSSGTFTIENGTLQKDDSSYKISINGEAPKSGKVNLINGEVTSGCLVIDKYFLLITDSQVVKVGKEDCPKMIPDHIVDDVIYYDPGDIKANPQYFNPETAEYCTQTEYNSNMTASGQTFPKTGCLKWYAYSENPDGTINMILAHNTTNETAFVVDETDYYDGASVGITYDYTLPTWRTGTGGDPHTNHSGPVTVLKKLKEDTDSWSSSLVRSDSHRNTITPYTYNINYTGYKARLLSAEEIYAILNINNSKIKSLYLDTGNITVVPTYERNETSIYSWLYDYTWNCNTHGCSVNIDESAENQYKRSVGHWTSTALGGGTDVLDDWYSYAIDKTGGMKPWNCLNGEHLEVGVRPVITFEKPENF